MRDTRRKRRCLCAPARGFTLIEMVVSLGIVSIIAMASAGVMRLASRAATTQADPLAEASGPGEALRQIQQDLRLATRILRADTTSLRFQTPDRNGDALPETIEYAWSGVAGAQATRSVNGSPASTFLTNVTGLDFSLEVASVTAGASASNVAETRVVTEPTSSGGTDDVTCDRAVGIYLGPTLASNVRSWRPTRIRVRMQRDESPRGNVTVQLRIAQGDAPSGALLASWTLSDSTLSSSASYQTFTVPASVVLDRETPVALSILAVNPSTGVEVVAAKNNPPTSNTFVTQLNSGGTSWVRVATNAAFAELYAETSVGSVGTTQQRAIRANVGVSVGGVSGGVIRANFPLLNQPLMP